tara:strand:- start:204 stop:1511 length:1308 start_codon:yes stop_codon:yes gene_type:complete
MVNIDNLVNEWAYRCKKGYPDMDSPSDLRLLKVILKEQGITIPEFQEHVITESEDNRTSIEKDFEKFDDELDKQDIDPCVALKNQITDIIDDMVASGDLDPNNSKQISKLVNRTCAFRLEPTLKQHLTDKGFSSLILKQYAQQIRDLTEDETSKDRKIFNEYLKNSSKQINFPPQTKGNLKAEMGKSGLPNSIITKLITHTAQDEGKKGVGMGELALAIVFKDITDSVGKGDLALDGEYFEIKAQAATLGAKPEAFKASLDTVRKFEIYGLKREPIPNKKGTGSTIKLTFNGIAYKLNAFTEILPLIYQATNDKEGLKSLFKEMLIEDAKHSPEAVEYGIKDIDLTKIQSIQSTIAKIHFYNYVEGEGFTHFLAHDMGQKSKKGIKSIIGNGEYIYVKGTPGEMADALMEAGAAFEKTTFNNMRPRIGFGSAFTE